MKNIFKIWLIMVGTFLYATVPTEESVTKLYIATFDRVPDAAGLKYWINDSKLNLEEIAESFFDQPETKAKYPSGSSNTSFINNIYQNILGREADSAGFNYWLVQLNSGKIEHSVFILALINGALNDDKKLLENKTIVGIAFVKAGKNNITEAIDILKGVTISDRSIDEALDKFGLNSNNNGVTLLDKRETVETIAKEWYVRIVAEDTTNNMKTAAAQLGKLDIADVVSKYTLKALAPFRPTYLDVVFVNPSGVASGSYTSNFHISGTASDTWEFTVKSHDTTANIILSLRGLYVLKAYTDSVGRIKYNEYRSLSNPLVTYMTLLDVSTNTEINVFEKGKVNEYLFNMNGVTERVFRLKIRDSTYETLASIRGLSKEEQIVADRKRMLKKLQIKALRKDAKARPDALKRKRLESFDMLTPPTFEVLVK